MKPVVIHNASIMIDSFILSGARILLPERVLFPGKLVAEAGVIQWVGEGEVPGSLVGTGLKKGSLQHSITMDHG